MKRSAVVARVLLTLSVICALVPVWWWALFGMSEDVGTAWGVTFMCLLFPGLVAWMDS